MPPRESKPNPLAALVRTVAAAMVEADAATVRVSYRETLGDRHER